MSLEAYTRRPLPPGYDPVAFWTTELQNLQRAITSTQAVAIETASSPLSYDPATHTLSISGGTGPTTAQRSSDVANSTTGGANAVSTGLTLSIANGESWAVQWQCLVKRNAAPAGGATFWLATIPSASKVSVTVFSPTTGVTALIRSTVALSGTPALLTSTVVNFDPGTQGAKVTVEMSLRNVTSAGMLDVLFGPSNAGDTVTVMDGSYLLAQRL